MTDHSKKYKGKNDSRHEENIKYFIRTFPQYSEETIRPLYNEHLERLEDVARVNRQSIPIFVKKSVERVLKRDILGGGNLEEGLKSA